MIKAINLWLQHPGVTGWGEGGEGSLERARKRRQRRLFQEWWKTSRSSTPHPCSSQRQGPRGLFQHRQAWTATPTDEPSNFWTWEVTRSRQRPELTGRSTSPTSSPATVLFPYAFKAGSGQIQSPKPPILKLTVSAGKAEHPKSLLEKFPKLEFSLFVNN